MSDFEDHAMETLAKHLSRTYASIATVCLNLPIPVAVATGTISNLEATPAVRRVMEIAEDQPMPEEQQATLFGICAYWLGALDLYGLLTKDFHPSRAHSAAACLISADGALMDLTVWLVDSQSATDPQD